MKSARASFSFRVVEFARLCAIPILFAATSIHAESGRLDGLLSAKLSGLSQTILFTPISVVGIGVAPITLTATSSSGLKLFAFTSASPISVCTVSGNRVTIVGVGTCSLSANQGGDATYAAASADASIEVLDTLAAISFIAVISRKMHGTLGPFDIPIDTALPPSLASSEPRLGAGRHDIVFQFSGPVTSVGSVGVLGSPALYPSFISQIKGSEVTVTIASDAIENQVVTACLSGVNGALTQSAKVSFLPGDVNATGAVNAGDIVATKAHEGGVVDGTNFVFDVNTDGTIDKLDRSIVKSRSGTVAPAPLILDPLPWQFSGPPPASGMLTVPYSFTFSFLQDFALPVTWSVSSGALPPGLTLNPSSGVLSGTPTTAGAYKFAVRGAHCFAGDGNSPTYSIDVAPVP